MAGLGFGGRKYCTCDGEGSRVLKTEEEGEHEEEESTVWSKTLSKFGEKAMSLMYHSSSISSMGFKAQREPKSSLFSTKPGATGAELFGFEFLAHEAEAEFSSSLSSIQPLQFTLDIMASEFDFLLSDKKLAVLDNGVFLGNRKKGT